VTVSAPVDQIPIFVRAGAILPFKPENQTAALNWSDPNLLAGPLVWKAYPSKVSNTFTFTLPDTTTATLQTTPTNLTITGTSPTVRPYEVIVVMTAPPTTLQLDGKPPENTYYDQATHQIHITFTNKTFTLLMTPNP
jgi:alpha-glucosidase (family GH31 glycosyl hydrolase)